MFVLFGLVVALAILLALGRWYPGSGEELRRRAREDG